MAQVNHQTTHGPMPREWRSLPRQGRFYHTVMREGIWVWEEGRPLKEGKAARCHDESHVSSCHPIMAS